MLTCRDVTELTTEYLEGALPLHRRLGLRFHLAYCSFCRRHLAQVRATVSMLRNLPPAPLSPKREDELVEAILHAGSEE
jgi:anti-sigma factor RsiW